MACGGNSMSDERIGATLIKEVIEEELRDASSEIPPLIPLSVEVQTEQEQKVVNQLRKIVCGIGKRLQDDAELQHVIDGVAQVPSSMWETFRELAQDVFEHGITWERIAVLFYVAGRLAVKLVVAHVPEAVKDILTLTVDFFNNDLLSWILEHGGWMNSFSELAMVSMQTMPFTKFHTASLVLIFAAGLALGSVITWKVTR